MPSLPSNIDLTEDQDFREDEISRYINGSHIPLRSGEGKINIVHFQYDYHTHQFVKMKLVIPPWYTWKCDLNRYDCIEMQTGIEQDAGIRFDDDIEHPFLFGTADEREDNLIMLESFRAECLGHFCYKCGKELHTLYEQSICLCNICNEEREQDKILQDLNLHKIN